MLNLFRAEWLKIAGNRYATAFLMWIFPMSALAFSFGAILLLMFSSDLRVQQEAIGIDPWYTTLINTWSIINNEFGRYIIVAFAAVVFAGEFQYGTWKNLITRRARATMIVNKFVTLAVFVTTAFVMTTLIMGVSTGVAALIMGESYGAVNGETIGIFLADYPAQMFVTLATAFIAAGYAAILAMSLRNILAAAIGGVLFTIGEQAILLPLTLLDNLLDIQAYWVYQLMPTFNLSNISNWTTNNAAYMPFGGSETALEWFDPVSLGASLVIVCVWIAGLIALTAWRFSRADVIA